MTGIHFSSASSDWETPEDLFERINAHFNFKLDVCASYGNTKCIRYLSPFCDSLNHSWVKPDGSCNGFTNNYEGFGIHKLLKPTCWMNPPYGRQIPSWVEKAALESTQGVTVVALLPARVDTQWWLNSVMWHAKTVVFLVGRVKFVGAKSGAPFPSAVVEFGPIPPDQKARIVWWDWKNQPWGEWE